MEKKTKHTETNSCVPRYLLYRLFAIFESFALKLYFNDFFN